LRPIWSKHGFALSFNTDPANVPPEYVRVMCDVSHRGGHTRHYQIDIPADGKGAKGGDVMTKTHAMGSGVSYGMRYLLKMIFNVAVGEGDDDGVAAGNTRANGGNDKISPEQLQELINLADDVGADKAKFCAYFKVESLADIPMRRLQQAKDA